MAIPLLLSGNMPSHGSLSSEKPRGCFEPLLPASSGTGRGGVAVKAPVKLAVKKMPYKHAPDQSDPDSPEFRTLPGDSASS